MNYAEDRRDRRARHGKESNSSIPSSRSRLSSTPAVIADLSSAQSLLRSASVAVFEESPEALNKLREGPNSLVDRFEIVVFAAMPHFIMPRPSGVVLKAG